MNKTMVQLSTNNDKEIATSTRSNSPSTNSSTSTNTKNILDYLCANDHRYTLSVILSYLNENEGTSLLITNKIWARCILPIFQLPDHLISVLHCNSNSNRRSGSQSQSHSGHNNSNSNSSSNISSNSRSNLRNIKRRRHRFARIPCQDPTVLLSRLNTKRLAMRIRIRNNTNKTTNANTNANTSITGNENQHENQHDMNVYPLNMTTEEISWYEFTNARLQFMTNYNSNTSHTQEWNAKLELLRYRTPPSTSSSSSAASAYKIPTQLHFQHLHLNQHQSIPLLPPIPKILAETTLLTSYPRSGNTLLRNLIERITNIITGSDTRPDRKLSKSLALDHDLVGEGIVKSSKTPIIKTHFPERLGYVTYDTKRIILLVRNPYDSIDSYWNMCCTNTHTESVVEDVYDLYREKFESLAKNEICTWLSFVKYWLGKGCSTNTSKSRSKINSSSGDNMDDRDFKGGKKQQQKQQQQCPSLLVIRFEDLIQRTEHVMEQVISFMLYGDEKVELHPFWKWRIRHGLDLTHSTSADASTSASTNTSSSAKTSDDKGSDINAKNDKESNSLLDNKSVKEIPIKQQESRSSVNTLQLGSYKPRSEKQSSFKSIGKSIRKGRYSNDILSYFQDVANRNEYQIVYGKVQSSLLELFDYDIMNQNFPNNFSESGCNNWNFEPFMLSQMEQQQQQSTTTGRDKSKDNSVLRINVGPELRLKSSPFGRLMTPWRRSQTDNDKNPFPTVKK